MKIKDVEDIMKIGIWNSRYNFILVVFYKFVYLF